MDFAADAVLDVAPPPRTVAKSNAPADTDAPSFDDHLAAAQEDAQSEETSPAHASVEDAPSTDANESSPSDAAAAPVIAPPTVQAEQPSLPLMVQLIINETLAPTSVTPVTTPTTPAVPAPAAPQTPASDLAAPPAAPTAETPTRGTQHAQAKSDTAAAPYNDSGVRQTSAQQAQQPQQAQMPAIAPVTQAATPTPTATSTGEAPAQTTAPIAPANSTPQADAARAAPAPHAGKSTAARSEEKFEVTARDARAAPAANAGPKQSAKSAAPAAAAAAKETIVAAPTMDASSSTAQSAHAAAATTPTAAQTQHAALDHGVTRTAPAGYQVGREIIRRFDGDNTSFELRLDPPELGRVEVKLEVSRDHRVTAVIAADSPQALTELARNARELEQMLQSAGLELSDSGLSFDLRQGSDGNENPEFGGNGRGGVNADAELEQLAPQARPLGYERWRGVRVDVMV